MNELKQKFIVENNNFESIGAIICYPRFLWTTNRLIEEIYLCLIKTTEGDGITRKYEKQVKWFLRRIHLWKPPPEFIIYRKDLSKQIRMELLKLVQNKSSKTLDNVITAAVDMLFESINEINEPIFNGDNYFLSAKRYKLLNWRFDRLGDDDTSNFDSNYNVNSESYSLDVKYLEKRTPNDLETGNKTRRIY